MQQEDQIKEAGCQVLQRNRANAQFSHRIAQEEERSFTQHFRRNQADGRPYWITYR